MVEHIESARRALDRGPWSFWGMSGGGWLAQIYAHRYPEALHAIVVESACPCFRERLADPGCVLSPYFPA
jgi:pimeloyl-ACP methyl ester carboxylesterase